MTRATVLIVGGGPVGLVLALGLARAGIRVTVVEAQPEAGSTAGDLVYQWAVLPGLDRLGILDDLKAAGFTEPHTFFRVGATGEMFEFDLGVLSEETAHPYNLHVRQSAVTEVLLRHLALHPGVQLLVESEVVDVSQDGQTVRVTCDGPTDSFELEADWLVGADGAHSVVRRRLGLGFPGITWPERLVAVELAAGLDDLGLRGSGYVVDPTEGAILACVEQGARWRYIYAEDRALPEELIATRLTARVAGALSPDVAERVDGWSASRIHQRSAPTFRVGRILLIGDAAHLTNPATAMGMLCGLFDSLALTTAMARVCDGAGDEVLDEFAEERRRRFVDYASPTSSERKKLVFNLEDDAAVEREISSYRRIAADRSRMRAYFNSVRTLET